MKSILKKTIFVMTAVSIVGAISLTSFASSFKVWQTGSPYGNNPDDDYPFSGSRTSIYATCTSATHNSTVTITVPGATTWTLGAGQSHTFNRSATSGGITCNVSLNPDTSGAETVTGNIY